MNKVEFIKEVKESLNNMNQEKALDWTMKLIDNLYESAYDKYGYSKDKARTFLQAIIPELEGVNLEDLPSFSPEGKIANEKHEAEMKTFRAWLKQAIDFWCDDGVYKVTPSSYDDRIRPETIKKAYESYKDDSWGLKFEDFLEEYLMDNVFDYSDMLDEFVRTLDYAASQASEEIQKLYKEVKDEFELIDEAHNQGYEGIGIALGGFLDQEYKLNIMLATPAEENYDMGMIAEMLSVHNDKDLQDNALAYLCKQQDYSIKEVFDIMEELEDPSTCKSKFLGSVAEELNAMTYIMSEVTLLVHASGIQLCKLLETIAKGEGTIEVPDSTMLGLFDEWHGSGSYLGIELEKAFRFPASLVRNVQFDGDTNYNSTYTVDQVYGLCASAWDVEAKLLKGGE